MLVLSVLGVAAPRVAVVLAVLAQGIVEDFPPGDEQDGLFILGSAASVEFRLDAPGNRDLILFRLVYTDGVDTHGWTEVGWYGEGSELTYDAGTGSYAGWFTLSHREPDWIGRREPRTRRCRPHV